MPSMVAADGILNNSAHVPDRKSRGLGFEATAQQAKAERLAVPLERPKVDVHSASLQC